MFESIELRRVTNGYILVIHDDGGHTEESVFTTPNQVMKEFRRLLTGADIE
jgi:hypothetical protein